MSDFTNELGVVDPIRPPANVVAFGGRLRLLPPYAIAFLGIFVARAIADLYAAFRPDGEFGVTPILSLILASMPDWLVLLTPVAVGWAVVRRGPASQRVTRGAIAVGLSGVVAMGARFIGSSEGLVIAIDGFVRMVSFVLLAGGLLWIARGLEALRTGTPSVAARRGAIVAIAFGVALAAVEVVARVAQILSFSYADYADAGQDGALLIANVLGVSYVLVLLAWAYLAWVLLRAGWDAGRSSQALRLGTTAGWLEVIWLGISLAGLALLPFATEASLAAGEQTMLSSIAYVLAISGATIALAANAALVAGLARGLAAEPESAAAAEPA